MRLLIHHHCKIDSTLSNVRHVAFAIYNKVFYSTFAPLKFKSKRDTF